MQRISIAFNQQNDTAVVHVNGVKILITPNGFLFFILLDVDMNFILHRFYALQWDARILASVRILPTSAQAVLVSVWLKRWSICKTITKFVLHELIYSEINLRFNHKMCKYGAEKHCLHFIWSILNHFLYLTSPNFLDMSLLQFTQIRILIQIIFSEVEKRLFQECCQNI